MTERDTDTEFDFFDEPETEEATQRVRTPRRPPPGGPPGPVRPPPGAIPLPRLARLIADQARLLVARDVNWDFYFKEPTQRELESQNIRDIGGVPDSNIIPNPDLASTQAMMDVWRRVHGAATGGTPGGKHGSALASVTALPDGKKLIAGGSASDNQITASTDLAFQVAVEDSGDFQEFNVGVTLTIQRSGKPITVRKKIDVINAGETKTVTFTNIDINGLFGLPTTIKVDIEPVPGETTQANNSAEYKVIFSLG